MTTNGWIAPEFEPDRNRRPRTAPKPIAWLAGILAVLLVVAMVAVATRAFFSMSVMRPGLVVVDASMS